MNISDEAVQAANKAVYRSFKGLIRPLLVQTALKAAAPLIMAQALEEAADDYRHYATPNARLYLRERAADLREYLSAGAGE